MKKRGQSIIEYAILILAVAAAFMAMNTYVNRAVNARLHEISQETNPGIWVSSN